MRLIIFSLTSLLFITSSFGQNKFLVDSCFYSQIKPNLTDTESYYVTYDEEENVIEEDFEYQKINYNYSIPNTIVKTVFNKFTNDINAISYIDLEPVNNVKKVITTYYENGEETNYTIDSSVYDNNNQLIEVYYLSTLNDSDIKLLLEEIITYNDDGLRELVEYYNYSPEEELVSSNITSYSYNPDLSLKTETIEYTSIYQKPTKDLIFYSYSNEKLSDKTTKFFKEGILQYCINENYKDQDFPRVTVIQETNNCVDFYNTGVLVEYPSDNSITELDSSINYLVKDDGKLREFRRLDVETEFYNNDLNAKVYKLYTTMLKENETSYQYDDECFYHLSDFQVNNETNLNDLNISIYPNPVLTSGMITISHNNAISGVVITDIEGKTLSKTSISVNGKSYINAPNQSGQYFIVFLSEKHKILTTEKLIVLGSK